MYIDLHAHSSSSDGSLTPEELVDLAISREVNTLALCDHDTTSGIDRFVSYGKDKGLRVIGGVELSATWNTGNCHILGLNVRTDYQPLEDVLQEIRHSRDNRNDIIIDKLNAADVNITLEQVQALAGGEVVARPHVARAMVEKGYVRSVQEAFDRYLAKGEVAYVDRYRLEPQRACELLRDAGAAVVLAHPSQLNIDMQSLDTLISRLKEHGLSGMEIYTPYTTDVQLPEFSTLAKKHNLFVTGGSDFHGESKPSHYLGHYRETLKIPVHLLDDLPF